MAKSPGFQHLPLLQRFSGRALIRGGGKTSPETVSNRTNYVAHSTSLRSSASSKSTSWSDHTKERERKNLPKIESGIPILLKVDPGLDIDVLREKFAFEIVSEEANGFVLVASEDLSLTAFLDMVNEFSTKKRGSATIASVHELFEDTDQTERLRLILSESLFQQWPTLADKSKYIFDFGIECTGTVEIPDKPTRGKRDTDADWARKEEEWSHSRREAYEAWDAIKIYREDEIETFVSHYGGSILNIIDGGSYSAAKLPDSFTVRIEMNGQGIRDLILSYPFLFEVVEPDDIDQPEHVAGPYDSPDGQITLSSPSRKAPAVCVIDSGIQEEHRFLEPAIDKDASFCFLPDIPTDVADHLRPGGHGTRVAGAILYGEDIPTGGEHELPFWIQNARILNEDGKLPVQLFPPSVLRMAIERFHFGPRKTRIFNHSINATRPCRLRHMSAWAAEADLLASDYDILIIQSAGNLRLSRLAPNPGISEHLEAGRSYPEYLSESSSRIANPAQSLQMLTVGSVAYDTFEDEYWKTLAEDKDRPSAFSRTGLGIWNVIKPEVVEYGGDFVVSKSDPTDVNKGSVIPLSCPNLVRSTLFPPGPSVDRDEIGTSFSAPKVSRIAARLQELLPDQSCLLYRALIVQSARWPAWAKEDAGVDLLHVLRWIGYGIPDESRATTNDDYRVTLIADGDRTITAKECHIYQVPIPEKMRRTGEDFDIRIDITLSYSAQPRRTRRNLRRYLSTWVEWKSSKLGESLASFCARAMKDQDEEEVTAKGIPLPWSLHQNPAWGEIKGIKRNAGTIQKDWAIVKSNQLPESFCIAVVGHQGWSNDPDSSARYSLAVSFEAVDHEIAIYEDVRAAVSELQAEIESEQEVDIELESEFE